jgi:hypothetical protein
VYAETLATVPINVGSYGHLAFLSPPARLELDQASFNGLGAQDRTNVLAHELFHAFSNAHGGDTYSALDEGLGIAVREYAFTNNNYNMAEMVYGTYSLYRQGGADTNYPMGDFSGADPKLMELVGALSHRDSSQIAVNDAAQLQSDYDTYFASVVRVGQPFADWLTDANQATADMLAARPATPTPSPVTATPDPTATVVPIAIPVAPAVTPSVTPEPSTIE